MINPSDVQPLARLVEPLSTRFAEVGRRLYLVGGVVRDLALASAGRRPGAGSGVIVTQDVDLTTDAPPDEIKQLVGPVASALWTQGERFGTIGARIGDVVMEITTHRAERYDPESRKPIVTFGHDLGEDLSRRDFTVNAMAIELPGLVVHDPYGGQADLVAGRLRTPLSPEVSFSDDPLRVMRAARFAARLDLAPAPDLVEAASALSGRLAIVSVERVTDELERLLAVADPAAGLRLLVDVGALDVILPSFTSLVGPSIAVEQGQAEAPPQILSPALSQALSLAALPGADPLVRRAGLLWPVRATADDELRRLRYSGADRQVTSRVLAGVEAVLGHGDINSSLVRRLVDRVGEGPLDAVVTLTEAVDDQTGRRLRDQVEQIRLAEGLDPGPPPLSGEEIMAALGIEPGPAIGRAQRVLTEHRLEHGPIDAERATALLRAWWADQIDQTQA